MMRPGSDKNQETNMDKRNRQGQVFSHRWYGSIAETRKIKKSKGAIETNRAG